MDLEKKKAEIEEKMKGINAQRKELYAKLDSTTQEFLRLEGEARLIEEMLSESKESKET